eukprot:1699127-Pleurochrysis_carterae.AAC.3
MLSCSLRVVGVRGASGRCSGNLDTHPHRHVKLSLRTLVVVAYTCPVRHFDVRVSKPFLYEVNVGSW